MTVADLITAALRDLGVLATSEVPSAMEQTDAFQAFTNMLDSMSTESLIIYSILREVWPLTENQQTYTFGVGGNFNSSRPQKITNALIQAYGTNPIAELPMKILSENEYANIVVKTVTSSIPMWLYNDDNFPLSNINLWPVSSVACNLVTYSWKPLSDYATVTTTLTLPPGYLRMLQKNLAIELAPMYGKIPNEALVAIALKSTENVKRMNSKPIYLTCDAALSGPRGAFNWLTGDTT